MRKNRYKRPTGPITLEWLKDQTIEDENGCWIWQRGLNHDGYGCLWYKGEAVGTHRVMYILVYKGFDPKLHVLHTCDVRCCINSEHLYQGTQQQNVIDRMARGRQSYTKGEDAGRAKLTEKQVKAIRRDSRSEVAVASDYLVGPTQIGRIRRRQLWTHI